jgi:sugar phosphate isomerase/epimerase
MPVLASLITTEAVVERLNNSGRLLNDKDLVEIARDILAAGFDGIELTLDAASLFPGAYGPDLLGFCSRAAGQGAVLTAHLPFLSLPTLAHQEAVRKGAVEEIAAAYRRVEPLPLEHVVLHLDEQPVLRVLGQKQVEENVRRHYIERLRDAGRRSLEELLETIPRDKLLVENIFDPQPEIALPLAEEFDLGLCLDIGHHLINKGSLAEFFDRRADRIRQVHLHDVVEQDLPDGGVMRVDHRELGQGILDCRQLSRLLQEHELVDMPVVFEMLLPWARQSLPKWREACG